MWWVVIRGVAWWGAEVVAVAMAVAAVAVVVVVVVVFSCVFLRS